MSRESPGDRDTNGFVRWRDVTLCIALKTERTVSGVEETGKPLPSQIKGLWRKDGLNARQSEEEEL